MPSYKFHQEEVLNAKIPTSLEAGKFQTFGEFLDKITKLKKLFGSFNFAYFDLFANFTNDA